MTIVFLVIIFVCLGVIAFVVVGKFPQLVNLDLANLAEEKQLQKKQEIIGKRIEEHNRKMKEVWKKRLQPLVKLWGELQLKFRIYVGKIEKLWYHEQVALAEKQPHTAPPEELVKKVENLVADGEQFLLAGNLNRAEELFINAIKLDKKSVAAYRGLADTYLAKGVIQEAQETYQFVLQLNPDDDGVMVKLAEIAENQGNLEDAIGYYQQATVINDSLAPRFYHLAELLNRVGQPLVAKDAALQAVQLEGKNPKYLDLLLETAIICGDRSLARVYYNELRLVNPENKKLDDLFQRIENLQYKK